VGLSDFTTRTMLFMVFSIMCIVCKVPNLDA
jgi:hypothetical protein